MKMFKCMNILNGIYACLCILAVVLSGIGFLNDTLGWFDAAMLITTAAMLLPFGPVAWLVCVIHFIVNCRKADYRKEIGKRWIWLAVWLLAVPVLLLGAVSMLVGLSGGV